MKYMLDTNICIYLMKQQPTSVARHFAICLEGDVVISSITLAELRYGVFISSVETRQQNKIALNSLLEMIPSTSFDAEAAQAYAEVRHISRARKSDAFDKLIAAHAISLGLVLVTNNESDFTCYPKLQIENWVKKDS